MQDVVDAQWDKLVHTDNVSDDRIIATHKIQKSSTIKEGAKYYQSVVSYSDDYFQTDKVLVENGYQFYNTE